MKKFVAILLTLMLVLGVSAAFADTNVTINKVYKLTNDGTTSPEETFTLEQVGNGTVTDGDATSAPALGTITGAEFAAGAATVNGATGTITVALPKYDNVGVYEYTLKEVAGNNAGVGYHAGNIRLVVTVINGTNGLEAKAAVHTEATGAEKSDTIENTYSAGTLNVSKTVTGNLGDKDKYFKFTVTLTGEAEKTYGESYAVSGGSNASNPTTIAVNGGKTTFLLKDGETIHIDNLPYGVGYEVVEDDYLNDGYQTTKTGDTGSINADAQTAAFTNEKKGQIDTGVTTESLPYVVLMGFVVLAGAALLLKRKAHNN